MYIPIDVSFSLFVSVIGNENPTVVSFFPDALRTRIL